MYKFVCQSLYVYLYGTYYSDFTQLFFCGFPKTQKCYLQTKICLKNGTLQNNYPKEQSPEKEATTMCHSTKHKELHMQEDVWFHENTCVVLCLSKSLHCGFHI